MLKTFTENLQIVPCALQYYDVAKNYKNVPEKSLNLICYSIIA